MDIFAAYATDESKEQNGAWFEIGDARFLIARSNNRNYARALGKAVEQNQKVLDQKNDEADALSDRIMTNVLAETILLGWEGVKFKGKPLAYSIDNAKKVLAIRDFRVEIMKRADEFDAYRLEKDAEAEKN